MNTLKIVYDSNASSPREDNDGILGTIAYKCRDYRLGEEEISDPIDWLASKLGWSEERVYRVAEVKKVNYYSDEVRMILEAKFMEKFIALPLYKYEHSGITIATTPFGCRWDSGQIGYVYTTKARVRELYAVSKVTSLVIERALADMVSEIAYFNEYIQGEAFGFIIEDEDEEELDSCWGFIGSDVEKSGLIEYIDRLEYFPELSEEEFVEMVKGIEAEY